MKVFIPKGFPEKSLNPIVKFLNKHEAFAEWKITNSTANANIFMNPLNWRFFHEQPEYLKRRVAEIHEKGFKQGIPVIGFNGGDDFPKLPEFAINNYSYIFSLTGQKGKVPFNVRGFPVYWKDALKKFFKSDQISVLEKPNVPSVGFCGYVGAGFLKKNALILQNLGFKMRSQLGLTFYQTETLKPSPVLREEILNACQRNDLVKTDFICNPAYKGGVKDPNSSEGYEKKRQFYNNILNNPYTLCIRGAGNFSVRFYETLSLGRIPVVYDTNQLWPYEHHLNYKETCVVINAEKDKIENIPEKIAAFHKQLSPEQFKAIQVRNRHIYQEYMRLPGIMKNFQSLF